MPKVVELPPGLKPFAFHGVNFAPPLGDNAAGDCPLCGREGKFFVNVNTTQYDCKKCGESGNSLTFVRRLWEVCDAATADHGKLAADRKLLTPDVVKGWGAVRSGLTGEWCLPGYDAAGQVVNLYRYVVTDRKTNKKALLATPGLSHGVHGVGSFDPKCETVYVCEGPWDGMAWGEVLGKIRATEEGYAVTANPEACLLATASVIALPGSNAVPEGALALCAGKRVVILFDSDHPREHPPGSGRTTTAGWDGARRLSQKLAGAKGPPTSIHVLQWGVDGYDSLLKSGFDVRDWLVGTGPTPAKLPERVGFLGAILDEKIKPIPDDWVGGRSAETARAGGVRIEMVDCRSWKDLVNQWRKAMKWPESGTGLDYALSVMLSSAMSTQMVGDQLWVKVISPPSTGKTQLCDGLGVNHKQVRSVGNFTGLHSGFQTDKDGEEDHSLLSAIKGMTLVVKDADTILKNPAREKILGQLRDAYDMNCAVAYGNKVKREYANHRFTVIMAGTEALMEMDTADLGARFLDCVVMDSIDPDVEADVNRRGFFRILNNRGVSADDSAATQDDAEMVRAKAMTGGYLHHLRVQAEVLLAGVAVGDDGDRIQERISNLSQYVAFARARPSKTQDEAATREMSARLNSQLTKLALCLAAVLNRKTLDDHVMARVSKVARDTARGRVLEILRAVRTTGTEGMEVESLTRVTHYARQKTVELLRFLRSIGAAEWFNPTTDGKKVGAVRWRLTPRLLGILADVDGPA